MQANTKAVADLELVMDDASFIEELTVDGWYNMLTSQGLANKDKSEGLAFYHNTRFNLEETVRHLWRGDSIAARIVELVVDDAMAKSWDVEFFATNDDGKKEKIDAELAAEIRGMRSTWEKDVGLKANLKKWWKRGRAYGGALLVFGVDDSSMDKTEPLALERVKSFDWIKPLTRHEVSPGVISVDPKFPTIFGKPTTYGLHPRIVANDEIGFATHIHATRAYRYDGIQVDDLATSTDNLDGWGDSIFERVWVPLRNWNSAVNAAGTIIQDFSQGIYSIEGLRQILRANAESLIQKQFALQDTFRSIWNATVIDSKDKYERVTTSVAGMSDLIDRFGYHLSAASGMPLTLLLGISPGGFGTGEAEENNWANIVQAAREEILKPVLEAIYTLLFATPEFRGKVPDAWEVVFTPLKQKSESDQAEIQNKQAQTDAAYINAGVLDPEEVAQSRFGKGEFSLNTTLDRETRDDFDEAQEELEANGNKLEPGNDVEAGTQAEPAKSAMNGAQVSGLVDIVAKVALKELPRDSAIAILQVAYLLSPEDANKVIGSAGEGFDEEKAEEEKAQKAKELEANLAGLKNGEEDKEEPTEEEPEEESAEQITEEEETEEPD